MALRTFFPFAILYGLLFAAFGAEVPFIPSLLAAQDLSPVQIGVVLAAATIAQFSFAPLVGLAADATGARLVLAIAAVSSAASVLCYLAVSGFSALLCVAVLFALSTAALNPLADALAVPACVGSGAYGRVRGIGSAGFIAGTLASGLLVTEFGLPSIVVSAAVCFAMMVAPIPAVPPLAVGTVREPLGGVATLWELLANRAFCRVLAIAGLVIGSHAMGDAFAVITWHGAGIEPTTVAILLALAVGSELVVFLGFGPRLVARHGAAACASFGAVVGCGRWAVLAESQTVWIIAASQLLHGLTFALVHLACMQVIARIVPRRRFATAQAIYGSTSSGLASATITLVSGTLYGMWHAHAFLLMSALCLIALPIARRLGRGVEPDADTVGDLPMSNAES